MAADLRESCERDDVLLPLKERVLGTLLTSVAVGAFLSMGLLLLQSQLRGRMERSMLLGSSLALLFALLSRVRHRLGFEATALAFLGLIALTSCAMQTFGGPIAGTTLATTVLLLLSALVFGMRGVLYASAGSLLSLALAMLLSTHGWVTPWDAELWNPQRLLVWLRYAVLLLCLGGGLALAFVHLAEGLKQHASMLRELREREVAERARREAAQQALERARRSEALAQLACGMAHDFNNNLSMIMGKAQLLMKDASASRRVIGLGADIVQSSEAAAEVVRHLLSLGRDMPLIAQRVEVESLLRRTQGVLRQVLSPGSALEVAGQLGGCIITTDAARLQQALLNLALNARDAMGEQGTFTIHISEQSVEQVPPGWLAKPGAYVVIACTDTGTGIHAAIQPRIFEPFFTTKEPHKGTGLGLSTVRSLVYESRGFIEVQSRLGVGTTFRLHLPSARERARIEHPKSSDGIPTLAQPAPN